MRPCFGFGLPTPSLTAVLPGLLTGGKVRVRPFPITTFPILLRCPPQSSRFADPGGWPGRHSGLPPPGRYNARMLIIDTHAHILPRDWPDLAAKYGDSRLPVIHHTDDG